MPRCILNTFYELIHVTTHPYESMKLVLLLPYFMEKSTEI